ncbi:hypothetical protein [Maridesulfovibrio hydrothermalis]|uniref:Lipoprotein n=1 Tax=Maridesulfovibrio hydrothermalis AM13 = DSM 14728 TaxID=1121451 RepID=L0RDA8_9BACT|nr:hypothetical protein [Maridesulfovibrio hydrothermalis]CCO23536.1 conserved exported protein of unknown function [Maridesulfovibrio hydrothermalis AM13 = DSM 14728]
MKKILLLLVLLFSLTSCAKVDHYKIPFDTGGRVYKVALLPWKVSPMNFDMKYRWTMTQSLRSACRESGAFDYAWSAYPVNGGNVQLLEGVNGSELWQRVKYGKYVPVVTKVQEAASGLGADIALLYNISADNAGSKGPESMNYRDDYVRLFLVDLKTGEVSVEFARTDFLRKKAFADVKRVTLRSFNKWLSLEK